VLFSGWFSLCADSVASTDTLLIHISPGLDNYDV